MSDAEITHVFCHGCGARVAGIVDKCPSCGGALMPSQRRTSTLATALEFEKLARDLSTRLEARGTPLGDALASRGRLLVEGFRSWSTCMPEQKERSRIIQTLGDWQVQSESFLVGERG